MYKYNIVQYYTRTVSTYNIYIVILPTSKIPIKYIKCVICVYNLHFKIYTSIFTQFVCNLC